MAKKQDKKSSSESTKMAKSLAMPVILGTIIIVGVALIGRKATGP